MKSFEIPSDSIAARSDSIAAPAHTAREYQRDAIDRTIACIRAGGRPVLVSPTGSGKSFMLSLLVKEMAVPTLWLTHRKELVDQAVVELAGVGIRAGVIMAGHRFYPNRDVYVASVDTVRSRIKRKPHTLPTPGLLVCDESHHSVAAQFKEPIDHWSSAMLAGGTATPFRTDGRGLGDIFSDIIEAPRMADLVEMKYLVEPKVFAPPPTSLKGIRHNADGEFNRKQLAERMDQPKLVGDILDTWFGHAIDARGLDGCYLTIGFASSVMHSKHMAAEFCKHGIVAKHVDGDTEEDLRKAITAEFAVASRGDGGTRMLWNYGLFGEGYNVPGVECIIGARPTESLGLHLQMGGRATRISAGKRHPIILDHAGNFLRHGRLTRHLEYTLAGGVRKLAEATGLRTCPKCYRLMMAGRGHCPDCKHVFTAAEIELPKTADGQLTEYVEPTEQAAVKTKPDKGTPSDREHYFLQLCDESAKSGDGVKAIEAKFQKRFGIKPVTVTIGKHLHLATEASSDEVKAAAFKRFSEEQIRWGKPSFWPHVRFKQVFGQSSETHHRHPEVPHTKELFTPSYQTEKAAP